MVVGLLMLGGGAAAGVFGSLLGLGGGILIVPLLTLGFGLPLREAVGVSLVCVIMTSSAAAGVYLERHVANLRLGMSLELFTAVGALVGGSIAFLLDERLLALLFAGLLIYVAISMARPRPAPASEIGDAASADPAAAVETARHAAADRAAAAATDDGLAGVASDLQASATGFAATLSGPGYLVHGFGRGIVGATGAGVVSALLGVGGGIIKVPLMHLGMGVPLKVATATSNLMIGITAAASAVIYLIRGEIDPYVAGPTAIGVFVGAMVGSRLAHRIDARYLRWLFIIVLAYTAVQMLVRALG
ncbi:MAG TPA: sulfite exporter TauE/SafE family protein [Candidatus Saccharimonadales bacterium]|nr:sulfite exporter TauE/SafE family protein [Candidatus Saccharimonadales bacterium]